MLYGLYKIYVLKIHVLQLISNMAFMPYFVQRLSPYPMSLHFVFVLSL